MPLSDMIVEAVFCAKSSITHRAKVRFSLSLVLSILMIPLVLLKIRKLGKCLAAFINHAFVWSFTGVSPVVLLDVAELFKGFITILALVLPDVGVHQHMLLKLLRGRKRFEALFALVSFLL